MDKLLDRLAKAAEREGISPRKVIASGELEGSAGQDGHGRREQGKFAKPTTSSSLGDLKRK